MAMNPAESVLPNKNSAAPKREQVATMFNQIATRYDFMNRLLSLGIDQYWRRRAINRLKNSNPAHLLDVATGTGDFAIKALQINPEQITGVDISEGMLEVGRVKLEKRKLSDRIRLLKADSENLPFADNSFDAATVAFGVRNFQHLDTGLAEIRRVLKPGAMLVVLEFSKPRLFPVKQLYAIYNAVVLPLAGLIFARHRHAYSYLPKSVRAFPEGEAFLAHMQRAGFVQLLCSPLSFGICSIYTGVK